MFPRRISCLDFNPRSPWGERPAQKTVDSQHQRFQSTLPVGGATEAFDNADADIVISIHAPRGGSDRGADGVEFWESNFNPRSPWGERLAPNNAVQLWDKFQSTLPVGGATVHSATPDAAENISIHAPRGGSDEFTRILNRYKGDFNPRSPWGERQPLINFREIIPRFQSTLPVGGATRSSLSSPMFWAFQSTLPVGGATYFWINTIATCKISIHAPRGGSDCLYKKTADASGNFNPRSPWGERHCNISLTSGFSTFQSTLPVGGATCMRYWRR